jgi:hypothetical protein
MAGRKSPSSEAEAERTLRKGTNPHAVYTLQEATRSFSRRGQIKGRRAGRGRCFLISDPLDFLENKITSSARGPR